MSMIARADRAELIQIDSLVCRGSGGQAMPGLWFRFYNHEGRELAQVPVTLTPSELLELVSQVQTAADWATCQTMAVNSVE